jgi:nitrogen PTS system EIIA component
MQLTVSDVADLLKVSEKTVYRWIKGRKLPSYRFSGQFRFNRAELIGWATANKINVAPDLFEAAEPTGLQLPSLEEALRSGGIFYRLSGHDKPAVLRGVVEHLRLPEDIDRELLLQMMLAREALEPTAVGGGIAFPHARNPFAFGFARSTVTLCFLESPMDYGALDGRPVHALFSLTSHTLTAHLHLLARLGFALKDDKFRSLIETQGDREAILNSACRISRIMEGTEAEECRGARA